MDKNFQRLWSIQRWSLIAVRDSVREYCFNPFSFSNYSVLGLILGEGWSLWHSILFEVSTCTFSTEPLGPTPCCSLPQFSSSQPYETVKTQLNFLVSQLPHSADFYPFCLIKIRNQKKPWGEKWCQISSILLQISPCSNILAEVMPISNFYVPTTWDYGKLRSSNFDYPLSPVMLKNGECLKRKSDEACLACLIVLPISWGFVTHQILTLSAAFWCLQRVTFYFIQL